jgi:hypothetical protein
VCHDASEAENKKAHKELALLRHPNRNRGTLETTAKFQAVSTDALMHTFNLEGAKSDQHAHRIFTNRTRRRDLDCELRTQQLPTKAPKKSSLKHNSHMGSKHTQRYASADNKVQSCITPASNIVYETRWPLPSIYRICYACSSRIYNLLFHEETNLHMALAELETAMASNKRGDFSSAPLERTMKANIRGCERRLTRFEMNVNTNEAYGYYLYAEEQVIV